jgi:deazaflavin-dependent oxidoreductase (nitroreductase family)
MELRELEAHRKTFEDERGALSYLDLGMGPATLFVHGVFMNALLWRKTLATLSPRRRCIAVDLPGHGSSPAGDEQDLSLTANAELLARLCTKLGLGAVDLVGNDTGGALCQVLAVRHNSLVRTLTLTNCDAHDNLPPAAFEQGKTLAEQHQLAPVLTELAGDTDLARGNPGLAMGYKRPAELSDELVNAFVGRFADPECARQVERFVNSTRVDDLLAVQTGLERLEQPTLIIWGTDDPFFEVSWAHWLKNHIPGAHEVVEVEGGGLFFPDEEDGRFLAALSPFLEEHSQVAVSRVDNRESRPVQPPENMHSPASTDIAQSSLHGDKSHSPASTDMHSSRALLNHRAARLPGAKRVSRLHAFILRVSGGRLGRRWSGVPMLILVTTGRKTGRSRATPVVYVRDGDTLVVLPAAAGSSQTPAWWLNLQAQPNAVAILNGEQRGVRARVANREEHDRLWPIFAAAYPDIEVFRRLTTRNLPLGILERTAADASRTSGGSRSDQLGQRHIVRLSAGDIHYRECGTGPALLLVHGLWVNGDLWRKLVPNLADRYRCITPDWPFGAHAQPLARDADLSPTGVGELIAEFIEALQLADVTVIANDTGVAFTQIFVANHPDKLARLVLTPGDVGYNFLPIGIKWMRLAAFVPGAILPIARFWDGRLGRRLIMFPLARRRPPSEILNSWFGPATRDAGLRRDIRKLLMAASPRTTIAAAKRLERFDDPALIVWTAAGRSNAMVFPLRHARRLQSLMSDARLELVEDSCAFISEDQPKRLAELIDAFVRTGGPAVCQRETVRQAVGSRSAADHERR